MVEKDMKIHGYEDADKVEDTRTKTRSKNMRTQPS